MQEAKAVTPKIAILNDLFVARDVIRRRADAHDLAIGNATSQQCCRIKSLKQRDRGASHCGKVLQDVGDTTLICSRITRVVILLKCGEFRFVVASKPQPQ
jgi:hypothetical protein